MRVRSKLAQIDFRFGDVSREGNLLLIDSHVDSNLPSRVYISPQDVVEFLKRLLTSPSAILFVLGLPWFLYRWHRSGQKWHQAKSSAREWPKV